MITSHIIIRSSNTVARLVKATSLLALLSLSALSFSATAADAANGEKLSQTCLGCHGAPGLRNPGPVYSIPVLGGQHADYIVAALKAYKAKTRAHGTMQAQAANLTDENMADIAAYFSSLEGNTLTHAVNAEKAKLGKEKAAACASCHGAMGEKTSGPTFPKLAGQYENYLVHALKEYRSGDRKDVVMSGFAAGLSIQDIKALSAYFASQQGSLSAPQTKIFK